MAHLSFRYLLKCFYIIINFGCRNWNEEILTLQCVMPSWKKISRKIDIVISHPVRINIVRVFLNKNIEFHLLFVSDDHSRVRIHGMDGDYINASFVTVRRFSSPLIRNAFLLNNYLIH